MLVGEKERSGIELYEKGYGKDAAGIAKEAIAYGEEEGFHYETQSLLSYFSLPSQRTRIRCRID
jgi:hypothetical protein